MYIFIRRFLGDFPFPSRNSVTFPWFRNHHTVSRFCLYNQKPPVGHRWSIGGFWLYNQQFSLVEPTVAFQPIFMSEEFATGGASVVLAQDGGEQ